MLTAEERTKETEKRCCYECREPILVGDDHVTMQVYDSPWGPPKEITVHVDNEDNPWDTCEFRLTDTGWADFRYFDCDICHRMICRQSPRNGWHTQVRLMNDGETEICLRCYEEDILENGIDQESFKDGKISGLFLNDDDLVERGFEQVGGFDDVHIQGKADAKLYCARALDLIEKGFIVATNYERMAIGGLEGFVTMWARQKVGC